jgi:hypothetical protein
VSGTAKAWLVALGILAVTVYELAGLWAGTERAEVDACRSLSSEQVISECLQGVDP